LRLSGRLPAIFPRIASGEQCKVRAWHGLFAVDAKATADGVKASVQKGRRMPSAGNQLELDEGAKPSDAIKMNAEPALGEQAPALVNDSEETKLVGKQGLGGLGIPDTETLVEAGALTGSSMVVFDQLGQVLLLAQLETANRDREEGVSLTKAALVAGSQPA
jgi:hypothetical protein